MENNDLPKPFPNYSTQFKEWVQLKFPNCLPSILYISGKGGILAIDFLKDYNYSSDVLKPCIPISITWYSRSRLGRDMSKLLLDFVQFF